MGEYGFSTIDYGDGVVIETLATGDGKSEFTDLRYEGGKGAIGISYGTGSGVGVKVEHNKIADKDMLIKWQIMFESEASVNAMIETLIRVKDGMHGK